jgi:hypothetical protein
MQTGISGKQEGASHTRSATNQNYFPSIAFMFSGRTL